MREEDKLEQRNEIQNEERKEINNVDNNKGIWRKKKFQKSCPSKKMRNGEGSGTSTDSEDSQGRRKFKKDKDDAAPKNQNERTVPVKFKAEGWKKIKKRKEGYVEEEKNHKSQIVNELIDEILMKSECKIYQDNIIRVILTDDDPVIEVTPRRKKMRNTK